MLMGSFDPYYTWLGIPPEEQPANHYRLLGLRLFESHPDAISNAADRQMMMLRTFQTGSHAGDSQKLLNEVAAAKICLLNPEKKAAYDEHLRRSVSAGAPENRPMVDASQSVEALLDIGPRRRARSGVKVRRKPNRSLMLLGLAVAVAVIAALASMAWRGQPESPPAQGPSLPQSASSEGAVAHPPEVKPAPEDEHPASPALDTASPVAAAGRPHPLEPVTQTQAAASPVPAALAAQPAGAGGWLFGPAPEPDQTTGARASAAASAVAAAETPTGETDLAKAGPKPAPDAAATDDARRRLKEAYAEEFRQTAAHDRLALAARLIKQAAQADIPPPEQSALLLEAKALAVQGKDPVLARAALNDLSARFEIDVVPDRIDVLTAAIRDSHSVLDIRVLLSHLTDLARQTADGEHADAVRALFRPLAMAARKVGGGALTEPVEQQEKMTQHWQQLARLAVKAGEDDADANLARARFLCLVKQDWTKGLALLARSSDEGLRDPAAQLVADPGNVGGQVALADAWWEMGQKVRDPSARAIVVEAARHWYEQALPSLADDDRIRAVVRLNPLAAPSPDKPVRPFEVPLGGLAGQRSMLPTEVVKAAPSKDWAVFQEIGHLEYPSVPASAYVGEFEFTLAAQDSSISIRCGDPGAGILLHVFWKNEDKKTIGRLEDYRRGMFWYMGERECPIQRRLRFTLYVNEERQALYQEDQHITGARSYPVDFCLRIQGKGVVVHRCQVRPWTPADSARLKWPMPPTLVAGEPEPAAIRLHERNAGLGDRPIPAKPRPFVIPATGTAMLWIEPGKFNRSYSDAKKNTEITISHGFWIGRCEVTEREWSALVAASPSRITGSPFLPVEGVGWEDAVKFCTLLTHAEQKARRIPAGYEYRLPTEAEWEYACRAGSSDRHPVPPSGFWHEANSGWRPHEVGEGEANAWGLYDMQGNVAEWCLDAWQEEPETPPWRLTDPFTPAKDTKGYLTVRGGGWWSRANRCFGSSREPRDAAPGGHRGMRLVLAPAVSRK